MSKEDYENFEKGDIIEVRIDYPETLSRFHFQKETRIIRGIILDSQHSFDSKNSSSIALSPLYGTHWKVMIFSDTRADGGQINQIVNYSHAFVKNAIKRGDIVLISKVKKKNFGVVDNSKWYNCAHHDAGYPDQECTCDESEQ